MRKKDYKGRTEKFQIEKCEGICITYSDLQKKFVERLSKDKNVKEINCNVPIEGSNYMTDVVVTMNDEKMCAYECVYRSTLIRPSLGRQLDISRMYWRKREFEWGLVIDEEESIDEE